MLPSINLLHLKFFCDAVIYRSVSESAKMNYVSQSAVSQAISKLEAIFGIELVFHYRQKLQVTDEGKIVFEQASKIFKTIQETFDKVNQTKNEIGGPLKFVTTKSLGMSFIASSYNQVKQNLPKLDFSFRMGGLNLIRTYLKREEAEFAIVVYDHNFDQFDKRQLKKGCLHLYQAKDAPDDLIDKGVFIDEYDGMYVKELKTFVEKMDDPLQIQKAIAGWELVARFTQLGIGVGFFPDYIVSNNRYPNIERHPLEIPNFEYEICAIFNKGAKLSRAANAILDQLTFG
jgi:LysR family carnitine catabolism transcriptional activator